MRIGVDLIEIARVRRALERHPGFRARCFTEAERTYCESRANPPQHYAARIAGQDAAALMDRAGRAVADEALRRFPDARSFGGVCGGGANGGAARIALEALKAAGRRAQEGLQGDVLIDGLFGTGFRGEPRPETA